MTTQAFRDEAAPPTRSRDRRQGTFSGLAVIPTRRECAKCGHRFRRPGDSGAGDEVEGGCPECGHARCPAWNPAVPKPKVRAGAVARSVIAAVVVLAAAASARAFFG